SAIIRGGNPILFPISGQLVNGEYEWNGRTFRMNNHGVARDMAWQVIDHVEGGQAESVDGGGASVTLRVSSTPETLRSFPYEFELMFTYTLQEGILTIQQEYRNHSAADMPMYAGFHPYFQCDSLKIEYETEAESMVDNRDGQARPFTGT